MHHKLSFLRNPCHVLPPAVKQMQAHFKQGHRWNVTDVSKGVCVTAEGGDSPRLGSKAALPIPDNAATLHPHPQVPEGGHTKPPPPFLHPHTPGA